MRRAAFLLLTISLLSSNATAEVAIKLLFSHEAWAVKAVRYDDGTVSCVAEVNYDSKSFSIWADLLERTTFKLQFYDEAWSLGEGATANIKVEIDSKGIWNLTNVELYLQSLLFNLPDENSSNEFFSELRSGNVLRMNSENGSLTGSYSLVGSSVALDELGKCRSALVAGTDLFASD